MLQSNYIETATLFLP